MKRILVTGASGFIGRQVCRILAGKDYEIHGTYHSSKSSDVSAFPKVNWIQADLTLSEDVERILNSVAPDYLIHLAWLVSPGNYDDPLNERWLEAGKELITKFHAAGGLKLVASGSCFEYDWSNGICHEDETEIVSQNLYGRCKYLLAEHLKNEAARSGRSWGWGRIFFVYGPFEDERRFVPSVVISLLKGELAKCSHGNQIRDYLHSADVASALVALMESEFSGVCNIGSGREVTLKELGKALSDAVGEGAGISFGALPARENEPPKIVADTARLTERLGWQPCYSLSKGAEDVVNYWRGQLLNELNEDPEISKNEKRYDE